jgi:hypothetical protein
MHYIQAMKDLTALSSDGTNCHYEQTFPGSRLRVGNSRSREAPYECLGKLGNVLLQSCS